MLLAIGVTAVTAVIVLLLLRFYPAVESLMQPETMAWFQSWLRDFGLTGALILVGLQTLQVLSGIIPALPIQIAAGLAYGAVAGLALCMCGILAGSSAVFALVKKFGQPLVNRAFSLEKQSKLAFLRDSKRLDYIVFVLYLLPAMPKDVFTFLAALTPLSLRRFLTITIPARIPAILCSTFASDALMEGNYFAAGVVFCVVALLGLLCMLGSKKIMAALERRSKS